jgi:plasmid maintenance system antidote protein VapI
MRAYKSLAEFNPPWIVHPGETVADALQERNINAQIFAMEMQIPFGDFLDFLNGEENSIEIDETIAHNLTRKLGGSPLFWENLQKNYIHKRNIYRRINQRLDTKPLFIQVTFQPFEFLEEKVLRNRSYTYRWFDETLDFNGYVKKLNETWQTAQEKALQIKKYRFEKNVQLKDHILILDIQLNHKLMTTNPDIGCPDIGWRDYIKCLWDSRLQTEIHMHVILICDRFFCDWGRNTLAGRYEIIDDLFNKPD